MQWDASPTAGFTSGTPWLPIVDAATRNVDDQRQSPGSVLSLYRRLIAVRHVSPALATGTRSTFPPAEVPRREGPSHPSTPCGRP